MNEDVLVCLTEPKMLLLSSHTQKHPTSFNGVNAEKRKSIKSFVISCKLGFIFDIFWGKQINLIKQTRVDQKIINNRYRLL
jgi:hypothetical protein